MTVWLSRFRAVFYSGLLAAGLGLAGLLIFFFVTVQDLPRVPDPLSRIIETPPTEIYAATGERLMIIGGRETVPLNRVSPFFIQAVIATEDHRFWGHHGLDHLRILKAFWVNLWRSGRVEGASTITQQLAKNLFFSFQRTYLRKFRELAVALQIEARYTKNEILEAYINQIAFGVGAHGIEQASQVFFGKPALQLGLPEAALLAGLPKSPTRYNPFRYLERARERQRVVLARMAAVGTISADEAEKAGQAPLMLRSPGSAPSSGDYFLDLVLKDLEERYGSDVVHHAGLKVFTTLDPQMQAWAMEAVQNGLGRLDQVLRVPAAVGGDAGAHPQGALVAVEAHSGAVRALVGGRDHAETEFNRALQNNRQPGSGFKPFLYYAALEKAGLNPATVFVDRKVAISIPGQPAWTPRNFSGEHEGAMILKRALAHSVNTVAAQLVERIGPKAVIEAARRCGIKSPLAPVPSVALGTSGVSPLEMAAAFACLATGGIQHEPFWIRRVEDSSGRVLEERILSGRRTLDASIAFQLVDMMRAVLDEGTGTVVRQSGFQLPAAGKTGTTDDFNDAWFTAFTPTLSVCVWVGFDRGVSMRDPQGRGITGARGAAPIWAEFMRKATEGAPRRDFVVPSDIRFVQVNPVSGNPVMPWGPRGMEVALRGGQLSALVPSSVSDGREPSPTGGGQ
jgi:1A family penicillin-binding protein